MADSIVCTRAVKGGSFSSEHGPTRFLKIPDSSNSLDRHCGRLKNHHNPYDSVLKLSNAKLAGVAPSADPVGLPHDTPAKAIDVDCCARFLQAHPVVDPITHGWYFDNPVFVKDLTFTLASDIDRNVIPPRVSTPTLSLADK